MSWHVTLNRNISCGTIHHRCASVLPGPLFYSQVCPIFTIKSRQLHSANFIVRRQSPTMSIRDRHSRSLQSLSDAVEEAPPNGPLSGPSSVDWRRQRLLRIGSAVTLGPPRRLEDNTEADERTSLGNSSDTNYGSIQPHPVLRSFSTIARRNLPQLPNLSITRGAISGPPTPIIRSPISIRATLTRRLSFSRRRISAYDAHLVRSNSSHLDDDINVRINGFRVWYSSFSSIDWLHDTIKDSVRFSRLRHGRSVRSHLRLLFDKSLGWMIVTIVGFLTAIIAFLVVRLEQWFFDAKYGYCSTGWWKAIRFCCPDVRDLHSSNETTCPDWVDWSSWMHYGDTENNYVDYISYAFIAVCTFPMGVYVFLISVITLTSSGSMGDSIIPSYHLLDCFNLVQYPQRFGSFISTV